MWTRSQHFCDVSLRSTDGRIFKAKSGFDILSRQPEQSESREASRSLQSRRIALCSRWLPILSSPCSAAALQKGPFLGRARRTEAAQTQQSEVPFDYSGEALNAFLEFLYKGTFCVKKAILPELLRLVHQWEVQPLQAALNELLVKHMTPELCSSLIVDCEVLLVDKLDEMLESYVLENFGSCVRTEQFGSWPLHRMIGILRSDDLVAEHEEEVLAAVMHWHRSGPGRDDATAALLQMVRFPLLSVAALQGLGSREGLTGLPGVVMSRLAAAALKVHQGCPQSDCQRWDRPDSHDEQASFMKTVKLRNAYPYWWADFGCSLRGGGVVAERSGIDTEGELEPWAVHIHDQSLYIIDGREPCCVLQAQQ
ncbi:KLHL6 [Symbiodinium sp. CCMP2592]|nr:KLHL6 [Symbiodinium sp. CCMP2592]